MSRIRSRLERFSGNPILSPKQENWWESKAVFNPGALYESGRLHLLYRAIGDMDVSCLGYASSPDGFHIDERLDEPAYFPREPFEGVGLVQRLTGSHGSRYASGGGGMGGCEDPRLTRIEDRVFLTYVAYNGFSHPRSALSSISLDDFLVKNWAWEKPVLISPPGIIDKNACMFPEKIGGKYVIFHRVFPDILIDFVDTLDFDGETYLEGQYRIPSCDTSWDSRKVGAGPPPLKTKEGWLLIYHGVDDRDPGRYKIGAMLLDLLEPYSVIARTPEPLMEPEAVYENEGWKSGVVYPCGAAIIGDRLFVYYGAADRTTCVATIMLDRLLESLKSSRDSASTTKADTEAFVVTGRVKGLCLRCRSQRVILQGREVFLRNGRYAIRGTCEKCGATMYLLIKRRKSSVRRKR